MLKLELNQLFMFSEKSTYSRQLNVIQPSQSHCYAYDRRKCGILTAVRGFYSNEDLIVLFSSREDFISSNVKGNSIISTLQLEISDLLFCDHSFSCLLVE